MEAPKVCILVCEGSISELIVREALKELGSDVLLCTLNETKNAEDIKGIVKKAEQVIIIVDSCSDECGKKRAESLGIPYDEHIDLGKELGTKLPCSKRPLAEVVDDVGLATVHLVERVKAILAMF